MEYGAWGPSIARCGAADKGRPSHWPSMAAGPRSLPPGELSLLHGREAPEPDERVPLVTIFSSAAVVQLHLHRVGRHAKPRHLLHLQADVSVDHVIGEYAAAGEELAILVEIVDRHVERVADRRGGSCSGCHRGPPSSWPRRRSRGSRWNPGSAPRCGGPSDWTPTECGSTPSGCARSTRASRAPRTRAPGACSCWYRRW